MFISHFSDLHKEQKNDKKCIFFAINFQPISPKEALLSKEAFVKSSCLKPHCVMYVRHVYTARWYCVKIPNKNCPKTKTCGISRVVPYSKFQ